MNSHMGFMEAAMMGDEMKKGGKTPLEPYFFTAALVFLIIHFSVPNKEAFRDPDFC